MNRNANDHAELSRDVVTIDDALHKLSYLDSRQAISALFRLRDAAVRPAVVEYQTVTGMTRTELGLVFFRRRLVERITVECIRTKMSPLNPAEIEDLANAICERLAARETGDPHGYRSTEDPK